MKSKKNLQVFRFSAVLKAC